MNVCLFLLVTSNNSVHLFRPISPFQMFSDDDGKEFIYKEPKITGLAEISQRLEQIYSKKHGKENIKLIMESAKVSECTVFFLWNNDQEKTQGPVLESPAIKLILD